MRQTSDTALFRKAFFEAGFRQATKEVPTVYSDLRKSGIRRIKLYDGDHDVHDHALLHDLAQALGHEGDGVVRPEHGRRALDQAADRALERQVSGLDVALAQLTDA